MLRKIGAILLVLVLTLGASGNAAVLSGEWGMLRSEGVSDFQALSLTIGRLRLEAPVGQESTNLKVGVKFPQPTDNPYGFLDLGLGENLFSNVQVGVGGYLNFFEPNVRVGGEMALIKPNFNEVLSGEIEYEASVYLGFKFGGSEE